MGDPLRRIAFAEPDITEEEIAAVGECLRSGWLTSGPNVLAFEEAFAKYVGARHAVAVNSATAGLHLALEAGGVGDNDLVITTPYTFTATAEVIRYLGADPLLIDVEPRTRLLDIAMLSDFLRTDSSWRDGSLRHNGTGRPIRAVMPVHVAGLPCDMPALRALATQYELQVVEDAAHSLPARCEGEMVGSGANPCVFSFYATKPITTGEGGMVTTGDTALADRMRLMRLHGIDRDGWRRNEGVANWYYEVLAPGFKYNLPDFAASLGLVQLRRLDGMHRRRRDIARRYTEAFTGVTGLSTPVDVAGRDSAWHLYILDVDGDRDRFIDDLRVAGVATSVHFIPLHLHPYYRERYGFRPDSFPAATAAYRRAVSIPLHTRLSDDDVSYVIDAVRQAAR